MPSTSQLGQCDEHIYENKLTADSSIHKSTRSMRRTHLGKQAYSWQCQPQVNSANATNTSRKTSSQLTMPSTSQFGKCDEHI
ncbi:hypothetical protein DPMN_107503 [Dreissena polymorpha]|uniref:Uncharacterized protein n=1 Tax=Dreissena polymorpha TaxID=45954 RepID=A0A9D4K756_DREPO|nr:hypothetical protein DPMN_107503 [Dreissena polymorpha]